MQNKIYVVLLLVFAVVCLCYFSQNGTLSFRLIVPPVETFPAKECINANSKTTGNKRNSTQSKLSFISLTGVAGRMGNQLFQIASLLGTAKKLNKTPAISASFPVTKYFNIPCVFPYDFIITDAVNYNENGYGMFTDFPDSPNINITIGFYLQSWKYFKNVEELVRKLFTIQQQYKQNAEDFIRNKSIPGYKSVCIHIRRGDFLTKRYPVAGVDYIQSAMKVFTSKYQNVQFIVVSDDMKWCRKNIHNVIYSPFWKDIDDMALLTLCDHVIVTSGTFGWWGAWLANGTTVYFSGFPKQNSDLARNFSFSDYYPEGWIGL